MSDLAAISGQVVDIQNDSRHKGSIKITVHVPAEAGPHLTRVLGWPTYTNPVPVGMARLNPDQPAKEKAEIVTASEPEPPARTFTLANEAGMLCNKTQFQGFVMDHHGAGFKTPDPIMRREWTKQKLYELFGVDSLSEILPGTSAAERFERLRAQYDLENR